MIKQLVKVALLVTAMSSVGYCAIKANDIETDHQPKTEVNYKFELHAKEVYARLLANNQTLKNLPFSTFQRAYQGFVNIYESSEHNVKAPLLTICDFTKSSNEKRLWVIDFKNNKVLFNTLVSHGKNSGEEYAITFSNKMSSYQSSLGFYLTDMTYEGGNGYSLKLKGLEPKINDLAMDRAIVMHGADYCSEEFIAAHGRLGRSYGCPAVPRQYNTPIINTIKNNTVLYIHAEQDNYLAASKWLKEHPTEQMAMAFKQKMKPKTYLAENKQDTLTVTNQL